MKKVFFLLLISLPAVFFLTKFSKQDNNPVELPKISEIGEFNLINQENQSYGLKDLKGSYWVASFIFTRCQGPCPLITKKIKSISEEFSGLSNIKFVSLSMDPDYDTPQIFKEYAKKYKLNLEAWNLLTGKKEAVMDITRNLFRLPVSEDPEMHTTRIVLVDSNANIRGYYNILDEGSVEKLILDLKNIASPGV